MGYGARSNGWLSNGIKTFWPDDTDGEFYIEHSASLEDIQNRIKEKWGDIPFSSIEITSEYIHTDCLYYDRYDPDDYTKFIRISKIN